LRLTRGGRDGAKQGGDGAMGVEMEGMAGRLMRGADRRPGRPGE